MTEEINRLMPKLLFIISNKEKTDAVSGLVKRHSIHIHYQCLAHGTASSEILDVLGLGATDKTLTICISPSAVINEMWSDIKTSLLLMGPGKGIAFTMPMYTISKLVAKMLEETDKETLREKLEDPEMRIAIKKRIESEVSIMNQDATHCLIMAMINQGYSDELMDAAREAGATGGTVIHARGITGEEQKKLWGFSIQEEREIVLILSGKEKRHEILKAIGKQCGFHSKAQGFMFALPVDGVEGLPPRRD